MRIAPPFARPLAPALLVAGLASVPSAQACGNDVVLNRLDAGVAGPELATPDGAPVIGGPFRLRVEGAQPNTAGAMVFSPVEAPFFSADYGATFWFGSPFGTEFFVTDADGRSPGLTVVPEVDPFFCNEFGIFQAGVFDETATGGVAVTNAIRLRVGGTGNFDFPLPRRHDSLSVLDIVTGDFDEDGRDDVVALVSDPFRVELRLAADFDSATILPAGVGSQAAAVDDLDGDGHLDLAIANLGSDDVSILLGNGDGTFASAVSYPVGDAPVSIAIGRFDGGTVPDVVVANLSSASLSFLAGNGDGTFLPATSLAVGTVPRYVVVGDWNGDRVSDLAVARGASTVEILTGNGDLTFDLQPSLSASGTPFALGAGDFDEDSNEDLVVLRLNNKEYTIFEGNGDGTFTLGVTASGGSMDVVVRDLDLDGHLDLLLAGAALHRGLGDGTFGLSETVSPGSQVAVGDVNGDGRVDVVSGTVESISVDPAIYTRRLVQNGDALSPRSPLPLFRSASAANVTGDDEVDLVLANNARLDVLPGVGSGAFGALVNVVLGDLGDFTGVETFDLDGDGVEEIVSWGDGRVDVYGGGSLVPVDDLAVTPLSSVRIAEASGDGIPDLVFIDELAGQKRIAVHRGNGDGTLGSATFSNIAAPDTELVLADVNGDGVPDAIHEHFVTGEVAVRLGTGTGFFLTQVAHAVGLDAEHFALGDFDGDSNLDLAVTGTVAFGSDSVPFVKLSLGNGDGTFQPPTDLPAEMPERMIVGDVDGDGREDLLVEAPEAGVLHLFRNLGGAVFAHVTLALESDDNTRFRALVRDVDGDGIPDLLTLEDPSFHPGFVRTHLNQLGE